MQLVISLATRSSIVVGVLFLSAFAFVQVHTYTTSMFTFPVHDENGSEIEPSREVLGSKATLFITEGGSTMLLTTHGLTPGDAVTAWWVIFNHPDRCTDGVCGEDDVFEFPEEASVSVLNADGQVISDSGVVLFFDSLDANDTSAALFGPGLVNLQAAEIHLVVRTHGPAQEDILEEQLSRVNGGCDPEPPHEPCQDLHFAIFKQVE